MSSAPLGAEFISPNGKSSPDGTGAPRGGAGCASPEARRLIVVVGPTASGKTDLALAMARRLGGEVISADSRQIYRGLSAGTAKPARDERGLCEGVPYHLIDCVALRESFDAARFARLARALAGEILARGRRPIVAGGTGLYVRALLDGLCELPGRDEALRRRLEEEASRSGWPALHRRLRALDPEAAKAIPAGNRQRLMRALEVHALTGRPISSLWREPRRGSWEGPATMLRLDWPIEELRARITKRAEWMWPGMLAEARDLAPRLGGKEPALESLGYASALACQRGEISPEEGLRRLIVSTCAYAKRQRTWFGAQREAVSIRGGALPVMLDQALAAIAHETTAA